MFVIVPHAYGFVVERLGRYRRTLAPGFHLLLPILDKVVARYSLAPQTVPLAVTCATREGRDVRVEGALEYRIVDPAQARYATADFAESVVALATRLAREEVARLSLGEARQKTRDVEAAIVTRAQETLSATPVGVAVTSCRLARIDTPALIA